MATMNEFKELTAHLGVDSDCPVCSYSWPACQGMCVAHVSMNGRPGPFHEEYNDDCEECNNAQHGALTMTEEGVSPVWKFTCGCIGIPLYVPSASVKGYVQCLAFYVCDTHEGDGVVFGIRDFEIKKVEGAVRTTMAEFDKLIHKHSVRNSQGRMFSELTHILKNAEWWDKSYHEKG